jgi:hypothetical protein
LPLEKGTNSFILYSREVYNICLEIENDYRFDVMPVVAEYHAQTAKPSPWLAAYHRKRRRNERGIL